VPRRVLFYVEFTTDRMTNTTLVVARTLAGLEAVQLLLRRGLAVHAPGAGPQDHLPRDARRSS
jgi:hypothetical protein